MKYISKSRIIIWFFPSKKITMKLSWSISMKWLKNVCRYDYNPYKKHILIHIAVCQLTKKKNPLHFINHNTVKSELFIGKMIQIHIFPLPLVGGNNFDVCIFYFEIQFITNSCRHLQFKKDNKNNLYKM